MGQFFGPDVTLIAKTGLFGEALGAPTAPPSHAWTTVTTGFEGLVGEFRDISYVPALATWVLTTSDAPNDPPILTSPDGVNWSLSIPTGAVTSYALNGNSQGFGAGVYCIAAFQGGGTLFMLSSPDLVTWTATALPAFGVTDIPSAPIFGNGVFLFVDIFATTQYGTSPDGVTWTLQNTYVPTAWLGQPVFDGTRFVAPVLTSGAGLPALATSLNGVVWTEQPAFATLTSPDQLTFSPTLYVVGDSSSDAGENGATVATVNNPFSFNDSGHPTFGLAYGGGTFCRSDSNGTDPAVVSSTDGTNWFPDTTNVGGSLVHSITFAQGKFIAVGESPNYMMTRNP